MTFVRTFRAHVRAARGRARPSLARAALAGLAAGALSGTAAAGALPPLQIEGDGIPQSLAAQAGDAARGRALLVARGSANCVLCHSVPDPAVRFPGNVGPSLAGVATRLTPAQLRLRVADNLRVNPATVMPSYYRVAGLDRVAPEHADQPILSAGEVEDIVAYLATLR
jgi:sulfur-oxidizing protein SoxX